MRIHNCLESIQVYQYVFINLRPSLFWGRALNHSLSCSFESHLVPKVSYRMTYGPDESREYEQLLSQCNYLDLCFSYQNGRLIHPGRQS